MENVSIKLHDDKSIIIFKGALNINHISAIKAELEELISFENDIEVRLESPDSIDVTFVQLLVALRNSCKAKGSKFTIFSQLSDDVRGLMRNAGLEDLFIN